MTIGILSTGFCGLLWGNCSTITQQVVLVVSENKWMVFQYRECGYFWEELDPASIWSIVTECGQ